VQIPTKQLLGQNSSKNRSVDAPFAQRDSKKAYQTTRQPSDVSIELPKKNTSLVKRISDKSAKTVEFSLCEPQDKNKQISQFYDSSMEETRNGHPVIPLLSKKPQTMLRFVENPKGKNS
jgi:hypothetical protein